MTIAYGTILDAKYLAQGLALYESWLAAVPSGQFYFFAMDDGASRLLHKLTLDNARIIERDAFSHPDLKAQCGFRSIAELCWASKPLAIRYMLDDMPNADWACYLDGDMALFGNPASALNRSSDDTFGLFTPHRFGPSMEHWIEKVGIHNAGFAALRHSPETDRVLDRWFRDCLARPAPEDRGGETFDQMILDHIAEEEAGIGDLDHPGINLAPWNADNYEITSTNGSVQVDGADLLLYHFQSLRVHGQRLFTLYNGDWKMSAVLRRAVYRPYVNRLRKAIAALRAIDPDFRPQTHPVAKSWKEYLVIAALVARRRRQMMLV